MKLKSREQYFDECKKLHVKEKSARGFLMCNDGDYNTAYQQILKAIKDGKDILEPISTNEETSDE